jgi:hypothetical protein
VITFGFTAGQRIARLRAQWHALAPPGFPPERQLALAGIFNFSAWVTVVAAILPGIYSANLGDNHRARAVFVLELCLLAALWLNRMTKLEWATRVAAIGILTSAT